MYKSLLRPLLFSMDPEQAHDLMRSLGSVGDLGPVAEALSKLWAVRDARLSTRVAGLVLPNPIGLAAGLDKNAELVGLFSSVGFGFLELGTVTAQAQPGNPRPRIFRFPRDRALINRMGFPSDGAAAVARRLEGYLSKGRQVPPLGINIGKSKEVELDRAVEDYCASFRVLAPLASYVAVNVSSPNTQALRQLQEKERLSALLAALQGLNSNQLPIFVKVAPDLSWEQLDEVIEVCVENGIAALVATNTTLSRDGLSYETSEQGGLSGAPLHMRSVEFVRRASERAQGRLAIIGAGGISSVEDVLRMVAAGAAAIQLYTALIYEGPGLVGVINRGLIREMEVRGVSSFAELRESLIRGT